MRHSNASRRSDVACLPLLLSSSILCGCGQVSRNVTGPHPAGRFQNSKVFSAKLFSSARWFGIEERACKACGVLRICMRQARTPKKILKSKRLVHLTAPILCHDAISVALSVTSIANDVSCNMSSSEMPLAGGLGPQGVYWSGSAAMPQPLYISYLGALGIAKIWVSSTLGVCHR